MAIDADWAPGKLIVNEYRVVRELGHRGMGIVHLLESVAFSQYKFAVKRVRVEKQGSVERLQQLFIAELQTWIDLLEHPHLVACRFFRTIGVELVIVAEYVEGTSLAGLIEGKKITALEQLLDLAIQFAWALHAAHEQGVIRQDVKPSNALVTGAGILKVADFGLASAQTIASAVDEFSSTARVVNMGGMTAAYCSPEQADQQPLSRRNDLWSWGVSVLEMFTGGVTWMTGQNAAEELEKFLSKQACGGCDAQLQMPPAVAAVLRRCFFKEPQERWPTLLDAAAALVESYPIACDVGYQRGVPPMPCDRDLIAASTQSFFRDGWRDPRDWLLEAQQAAGVEPRLKEICRYGHNRKAQAVSDLAVYQEAQALFERLIRDGHKELNQPLARLCANLAGLHHFLDDIQGALLASERAVMIYERLAGQEGGSEVANDLAEAYVNKANTLRQMGDLRGAMEGHEQAISIYEQLVSQEDRPEFTSGLASVYMSKASTLSCLCDLRGALEGHEQAITILERLVNREGRCELANNLARCYTNKAIALRSLRELQAAAERYDRAIAIFERWVDQEIRCKRAADLAKAYMSKAITLVVSGFYMPFLISRRLRGAFVLELNGAEHSIYCQAGAKTPAVARV